MTVVPQTPLLTSVFVVAQDSNVRNAVARLLSLDEALAVVGTGVSAAQASKSGAQVTLDEGLLAQLADLSIASFLTMVRALPNSAVSKPSRHLKPLASSRDMRAVLSERELQVVKLVAEGLSNKQISLRLELSDKTVKNHISHILAKMNLSARTQVAVHAIRAGLV